MKKILIILFATVFSLNLFSQNISIDCDLQRGSINKIYVKTGKYIVQLNSLGNVNEILLFDSIENAEKYLKNPIQYLKPTRSFNFEGIHFFLKKYISIEYYLPFENNAGKIKKIDNIKMSYYSDYEYNTGNLKSIGNLSLNYYTPNEYNTGKIKIIGVYFMDYYKDFEYHTGKLKNIGDVFIDYYNVSEYNTDNLKSIGNTQFRYYTPNEYNTGMFKEIIGADDRFIIL